jgi:hypothetical protein
VTQIFTQQWIEQTIERYKHLRDYQQPYIYRLASTEEGRARLEHIEALAAELPQDVVDKLIPDLRDERKHQHTYHELEVGRFLREQGFHIEYEKAFEGFPECNPDWYVQAGEHTPAFIVEVFTDNVAGKPKEERLRDDAIADLCYRIERINSDFAVHVRVKRDVIPTVRENKLLIPLIERWLLDEQPPFHFERAFGDVSVRVFHRSEEYQHTWAKPIDDAFTVDKQPLAKKIEKDKVDQCKDLSVALSLPLVICIVPNFFTARSIRTLDDILYGQEAVEIAYDEEVGAIGGHRLIRKPDGLFAELPKLSGVLWFEPNPSGTSRAQFIPNPNALLPLPPDLLGEDRSAAA